MSDIAIISILIFKVMFKVKVTFAKQAKLVFVNIFSEIRDEV